MFKRREFEVFKAYLFTHGWLNDTSHVICSWMVNIHIYTALGKWTAVFAWECAFTAPLRTRVESFNGAHHNAIFNHSWFTFLYTLLNILKLLLMLNSCVSGDLAAGFVSVCVFGSSKCGFSVSITIGLWLFLGSGLGIHFWC